MQIPGQFIHTFSYLPHFHLLHSLRSYSLYKSMGHFIVKKSLRAFFPANFQLVLQLYLYVAPSNDIHQKRDGHHYDGGHFPIGKRQLLGIRLEKRKTGVDDGRR